MNQPRREERGFDHQCVDVIGCRNRVGDADVERTREVRDDAVDIAIVAGRIQVGLAVTRVYRSCG